MRASLYSIIEIFRTNILIFIVFYYLRMASEEILKRDVYLLYKTALKVFFICINTLMVTCAIIIFNLLNLENEDQRVTADKLCMNIEFRLYRWGSALTSIIFLILSLHL